MRADAIVLAGGRASRMGGVDKPGLTIGGRTMLAAALDAVGGCTRTVVVGPERADVDPAIIQAQEEPRGSGPVAAIAAGLRALGPGEPFVVILAADMPFLSPATVAALVGDADATFAVDAAGRPQYLVGRWRRRALEARLAALDSPANQPMKALVPDGAALVPVDGVADCDTPDDVRRATAAYAAAHALDLDEARELLRANLPRLPIRIVPRSEAGGATLADALVTRAALPRFDVSAMDGYAVSGPGPWALRSDVGYAGGQRPTGLQPGEAVRIATGAHLPEGATSVLRDEFVEFRQPHEIARTTDAPIRDDRRRRGEDWLPGTQLASAGTPVTPAVVSAAASGEIDTLRVRGPVRAHVVVTGDEIRRDGPLREGQTRDSISPVIAGFLAACAISQVRQAHLRDTELAFDELFDAATDVDLIVVVGATGSGAADQLRAALARAGATVFVQRVRIRPGGSQVCAALADGRVVLGLPGNPFAALATLLAMGPAIVDGLTDRVPQVPLRAWLHAGAAPGGPVRILPARRRPDGSWAADGSVRTAHLAGLIGRDGLAVVPPGAPAGALVEILELPSSYV